MPSFDLVSLVSQINLIGVVFIVITLVLVIYELRLYLQDRAKSHIHIPTFSQGAVPTPQTAQVLNKSATPLSLESTQSSNKKLVVVGAITVICFLLTLAAFMIFKPSRQSVNQKVTTQPTIIPTKTPQVLLYTTTWQLIEGSTVSSLNPGDHIYLAIEPPDKTSYDLARFRVNETVWSPEHESTKFNQSLNVYYTEYEIPEGETDLKVDAQLHSKESSWPVELQ